MLYSDLDFERPPWDTISSEARALVSALLQRDADVRPTAQEALSMRYATYSLIIWNRICWSLRRPFLWIMLTHHLSARTSPAAKAAMMYPIYAEA